MCCDVMCNDVELCSECVEECVWQRCDGMTACVLRAVMECLDGAALTVAGQVCRAWQIAADDPALWRRLLSAPQRRALRARASRDGERVAWRHWARLAGSARWSGGTRAAPSGASYTHASLDHTQRLLALTADDASVTVLRHDVDTGRWEAVFEARLASRGWRSATRGEWFGNRLLVAGPLALAHRSELVVFELTEAEDGSMHGAVVARADAGPGGAAGGWLRAGGGGEHFLTLEARLAAPAHLLTTVWLNRAGQESKCEFASVRAPLLRVYNEGTLLFSHMVVVQAPCDETECAEVSDVEEPGSVYYQETAEFAPALCPRDVLVLAGGEGAGGGARGAGSRALYTWVLPPPRLPPHRTSATLADRREQALAARLLRQQQADEPQFPDEASVRALCAPPHASVTLSDVIVGLVTHQAGYGRCVWAQCADGLITCVRAPGATRLLVLRGEKSLDMPPHYVWGAGGRRGVVACAGGGVSTWAAGGAVRVEPPPSRGGVAVATLMPRVERNDNDTVLVVTPQYLYEWKCSMPFEPPHEEQFEEL